MRRLVLLVVATALAALTAPASASALVVGMADQKPEMFTDPRFAALEIRHARFTLAWDALSSDWQRAELDRWMVAAQTAGVRPLLSFGPSRIDRTKIPTPERLKYEFRRVLALYPHARTWATWNEANHCGSRMCHREKLVASYYRKMRQECPSCTILATELLDMPNMLTWVQRFRRYARHEPRYWGLHNYVEANRFHATSLKKLLRRVKGQVWLTEVGGIVKRRVTTRFTVKRIPESQWHAQRVTRFIFQEVAPLSPRITRVYLYHWNASTPKDSWDSALIGPGGQRRPAFYELQRELRELRRRGARRVPVSARAGRR